MLNDDPRPEDLPDPPAGWYAAHHPAAAGSPSPPARVAGGPVPEVPSGSEVPEGSAVPGMPEGSAPGPTGDEVGSPAGPMRRPRPGRRGRVVGLVAVLALLAGGLGAWTLRPGASVPLATPATGSAGRTPGPSVTGTAPTTPRPTSTDHPKRLDRFYTQTVAWSSCGDSSSHQCATVLVPVDYAKPSGDTFRLALRKVPATDPSRRVGSMLVNPGGPGGSGVQYAEYAAFVFSEQVRAVYDIVGFDPRGIGRSDAVACLTDRQMDQIFADDPTPDTPAERRRLLTDAGAITSSCAHRGGERARHMSSTEVAKDMDVIRALVGDTRLNYYGVSYGTFLGALYADLFPRRVGRFVLDSAVSPNQTALQETRYDIQGFESSIDAFVAWCVKRDDCALGRDAGAAPDRLVALLDRVDRQPLRTSRGGLTSVGEGWVGFAIFMTLYSDSSWPTLNRGLAEAIEQGKGDILFAHASRVVERDATGRYADSSYLQAIFPVRCADWPRTPDTPALQAARRTLQAAHPLWARLTGELYDACRTWPSPGRQPTGKPIGVGAAPILVIGNLRDPATPIGGTKQLARDLASGVLVTADNDGHGTYLSGNDCIDKVVDGYLVGGTVPRSGTAC